MVLKCRSCLIKVESQDSVNIFTTSKAGQLISDFLLSLAPIQIVNNDGFPTNLCRTCEEKVNVLVDFRTLLMTSDAELRKMKNTSVTNEDQTLIKDEILKDYLHTEEELEEKYHRNQTPDFCPDSPIWQENKQSKSGMKDNENIETVDSRDCCPSTITKEDLLPNFVHVKEELMKEDFLLEDMTTDELEEGPSCSEQMEETASFSKMSDSENLPSDIEEAATSAISALLPEKSKTQYEKTYERFIKWCDGKKVKFETNEKVLLAYFDDLSKKYKSTSLWAYYSMLRATISVKKNVDISKYSQLVAHLKRHSKGYRPKKSKVLKKDEVVKFLKEADDHTFLLTKVAMIIGFAGACRQEELRNLLLENVNDEGQVFHLQIPNTKSKISREFFVTCGNVNGINMVEIVRKYLKLRPRPTDHGRFFVGYRNGSCTKQPVGKNAFGSMPKNIASFLKLSNPEAYTGHCFRRSSTSLMAESAADFLNVKRYGV